MSVDLGRLHVTSLGSSTQPPTRDNTSYLLELGTRTYLYSHPYPPFLFLGHCKDTYHNNHRSSLPCLKRTRKSKRLVFGRYLENIAMQRRMPRFQY